MLDDKAAEAVSDKDHGTVLQASAKKNMEVADEILPIELEPGPYSVGVLNYIQTPSIPRS